MSISTYEITNALNESREQIRRIQGEAYRIGSLAIDDTILRNMSGYQLRKLKHKLQSFNANTREWK